MYIHSIHHIHYIDGAFIIVHSFIDGAFITTHFLDIAQNLEDAPPIDDLEFLQVEIDETQSSTFQFNSGVATTSLAVGTARRLGVDFERLSTEIDKRTGS